MSADLHTSIIQKHTQSAVSPSSTTHAHFDKTEGVTDTAAKTTTPTPPRSTLVEPAAKLEISSDAQLLATQNKVQESSRSNMKIKSASDAKAMLRDVQKLIAENPTAAKSAHTNLEAMRILHKIY